jgi:hypothetical protein
MIYGSMWSICGMLGDTMTGRKPHIDDTLLAANESHRQCTEKQIKECLHNGITSLAIRWTNWGKTQALQKVREHSRNFKVCKSMHHHTIQINQPTRCNNFSSLLPDVYVQLNVFRGIITPIIRSSTLQ